jgi:riboflavin transporter FmnP
MVDAVYHALKRYVWGLILFCRTARLIKKADERNNRLNPSSYIKKGAVPMNPNRLSNTRRLTTLALFAAMSYALVFFIRIPVVPFPPLNYDPKDVTIVIAGFLFGPLAVVTLSVVVSFIEMITVSVTAYWGLLMNILATCSFALPAVVIYRWKRTLPGAAIGLVTGALFATGMMLLWNYLVVPIYMGFPRAAVAEMLVPVFLPFNLLKTGLNVGFVLLLYKPVRTALQRSRMLSADEPEERKRKINLGVIIAAAVVIITCVLFILAWRGVI